MVREAQHRPRIGIPYLSVNEEVEGEHGVYDQYRHAVATVGGEPVEISLCLPQQELEGQAGALDAMLLPGSAADVSPERYGAPQHPRCKRPDPQRERTDWALLEHAFGKQKPILAICYGIQSLNVYLGGSLFQDIPSELPGAMQHVWLGREQGAPEPKHAVHLEPGSRLAKFAGAGNVVVNSSHHQAICEPGHGLRVTARAPDGVVEAVEWTRDANWVAGVQWHPERLAGDALAARLLAEFIAAARGAQVRV